MKPALTAEEWHYWLGHDDYRASMLAVACDAAAYSLHQSNAALAALALYGQPFGFTREDVQHLRVLEHTGVWPISANSGSLADRLEALLPPEG